MFKGLQVLQPNSGESWDWEPKEPVKGTLKIDAKRNTSLILGQQPP